MDVGIVCSLELETSAIVARMGRRQKTIGSGFTVVCGTMSRRPVAVVRRDAGHAKLVSATDALLTVHRPKWLIAAGFAVGIDAKGKRGDLFVATDLVNDRNEVQNTQGAAIHAPRGVMTGRLVSIATVPRTTIEKRRLAERTGAVAADQSSWAIAKMAADHHVPFLAIRVLIDDALRDSEPEARAVYHPSTSYRLGGVVGALISGSGHVGKIWKIRSTAKRHAARLAEFLREIIPTLAGSR